MDVKKLLLCFGERRTAVEVPGDGGRTDILQVVQQEYGEAVAGEPLLQLSWVDMREREMLSRR